MILTMSPRWALYQFFDDPAIENCSPPATPRFYSVDGCRA
jgi:hypothetical protein